MLNMLSFLLPLLVIFWINFFFFISDLPLFLPPAVAACDSDTEESASNSIEVHQRRPVLPAATSSPSLPSISGDSWIEESYGNRGEGASSSAPNQGQLQQGETGVAPGQPPLVVEPAGPAEQSSPSVSAVKEKPKTSLSSFFEGLSGLVQDIVEPGEERNSQPYQGVGQRLPGSLEISSPGISGESLFRDLEQPSREPSPQPEAAPPAPNLPPVGPPALLNQVKAELSDFLSSFGGGRRKAPLPFLSRVEGELAINNASPEKLEKIKQLMEALRRGPNKPNSGKNAAALLTNKIKEWAEGGGG